MIWSKNAKTYKRRARYIAIAFTVIFMSEIVLPTVALAIGGGPGQPEFSGFKQASADDMVDLFTGDFSYNIPLFEIDGYPVNISYQGNSSMDTEASWVGLGWSLNPGMVSRTTRGIPDDFNGDQVIEEYNIRDENEYTIHANVLAELVGMQLPEGFPPLDVMYTTGKGFSLGTSLDMFSYSVGPLDMGVSANISSQNGITLVPSVGLSYRMQHGVSPSVSAKAGYGSRTGFQNLSLSHTLRFPGSGDISKVINGVIPSSAHIPIGRNTYFPYSIPKFKTAQTGFAFMGGGDAMVGDGGAGGSGSYKRTYIPADNKDMSTPAYGYLNLQYLEEKRKEAENNGELFEALTDFNRDGDAGTYYEGMEYLAPSALTFDLYSVVGQGLSGMIRPHRRETGAFADKHGESLADLGLDIGIDAAAGNTAKGGAQVSTATNKLENSSWSTVHGHYGKFDGQPYNTLEQNIYFDKGSENNILNTDYYNSVGAEQPVSFSLSGHETVNNISLLPTSRQYASSDNYQRQPRNEYIGVLLANEAAEAGFDTEIHDHDTEYSLTSINSINRFGTGLNDRKEHHISEIIATQTDGSRYVFGIPAVNLYTKEVSLNVSGGTVQSDDALIQYDVGDNSKDNDNGVNHFFNSKRTPIHTHSHLLTGYLGADYVDVTRDGISDDDIGMAVKFNWQRTDQVFNWRTPMSKTARVAFRNPGHILSDQDDIGTYSCGQKELWYMHSMESKNYVAFFELSERADGLGVDEATDANGNVIADEDGVIDTDERQQKLNKITVYAKQEWEANGIDAEPIKTIEFYYDYSLCKGIPNNYYENFTASVQTWDEHIVDGTPDEDLKGKLTLKKVVIKHGDSDLGENSPYEFTYGDGTGHTNPDYVYHETDRWGNFKSINPIVNGAEINHEYFPYVNDPQLLHGANETYAEKWPWAWQITGIDLPTGGHIDVEYESDKYRFVQNEKATAMYHVMGIGETATVNNPAEATNTQLHDGTPESSLNFKYLYVELPKKEDIYPAGLEPTDQEYLDLIFEDLNMLYYRMLVSLTKQKGILKGDTEYDYIRGYTDMFNYGYAYQSTGQNPIAYIHLAPAAFNDDGEYVNPIAKSAMDFIYLNYQSLIFGGVDPDDGEMLQTVKNIVGMGADVLSLFSGPYKVMMKKEMAHDIDPNGSMIRLNHPAQNKYGGGNRVKKITISDDWDESSVYGKEYTYIDTETGLSSGVASYEPFQGNDEGPFKRPSTYLTKDPGIMQFPEQPEMYQELPMGELFYPTGTVGYSQVQVKDIHQSTSKSSTVLEDHGFYTAYDFPWKVSNTKLDDGEPVDEGKVLSAIGFGKRKRYTATAQGYVLEFNDMHGKPMFSTTWMDENGYTSEELSHVEYIYNVDANGNLDNTVPAVSREGEKTDLTLGVEMDVHVDSKMAKTNTTNTTVQGNLSSFITVGPLVIPFVVPQVSGNKIEYRSAVVTKILQRSGILTETVYRDKNITTTVRNEYFDAHTGAPLITSTETAFHYGNGEDDIQYELNFPAYHVVGNDLMGHAYRNGDYRGAPEDFVDIITDAQYNDPGFDDDDKEALKEFIYRGFCDGLLNTSGCDIYSKLSGNIVQEGVFAEGDEVWVNGRNEVLFAAEVITEDEMDAILALIGSGTNPITTANNSGGQGGSGGSGGNSGGGNVILNSICGGASLNDPDVLDVYLRLVTACQNPQSYDNIVLSSTHYPIPTSISDELTAYVSLAPQHYNYFYDIWNDPGASTFYNFAGWFLNNTDLRGFLSDIEDNNNLHNALVTLLECDETRECFIDQTGNSVLLEALDEMHAIDDGRQHLIKQMARYWDEAYVFYEIDATAPSGCNLAVGSGTYEVSSSGCKVKAFSYKELFNLGVSGMAAAPIYNTTNASCVYGVTTPQSDNSGVIRNCSNHSPIWYDVIPNPCPTITENNGGSGGNGGAPGGDDNVTDDDQDYTYNEPEAFSLVMFVDKDGIIQDLNAYDANGNLDPAKIVQVVRSGRRNMQSASVGSEVSINTESFDLTTSNNGGYMNSGSSVYSEDWRSDYFGDLNDDPAATSNTTELAFNPFVEGQRGVHRIRETHIPSDYREYGYQGSGTSTYVNSREDGMLKDYVPFWEYAVESSATNYAKIVPAPASKYWIKSEEVLNYSGAGGAIETVNPLGIHSCLLYGENNMVVGEAVNAKHTDVVFESFEDYGSVNAPNIESENGLMNGPQFEFFGPGTSSSWEEDVLHFNDHLTNLDRHAGVQSFILRGSEGWNAASDGYPTSDYDDLASKLRVTYSLDENGDNCYDNADYRVRGFIPSDEREYIVTLWVKTPLVGHANYDPTDDIATLKIDMLNGSSTVIASEPDVIATGRMIEGWMRIESPPFTVPATAASFRVEVDAGACGAYVDDLRIIPADAKSTMYVYDPVTHRLITTLDDNHYATFYKYDYDGNLKKLEKETERGRLTIKETLKANKTAQ